MLYKQTMIIPHDDPRLSWHGHVSLEQTEEYTRPWRIPFAQKALFHVDLAQRASTQAGIRLAIISDTRSLSGKLLRADDNQKLDLYVNRELFGTVDLAAQDSFAFDNIPEGEKLLELWLPQRGDFALQQLEVEEGASLAPYHDERPRWITYGSSITHCREAASPSFTWPAIVARAYDFNHVNLGFGGHDHLDALIACEMRDMPADYISFGAGINICGGSSMNARTFGSSVIGFARIIREKHPTTPMAIMSPIYCKGYDESGKTNLVEMTLPDYRQAVHDAVEALKSCGDENVFYVNGLELLNHDMTLFTTDEVHPTADGYKKMGENFLQLVAPRLFGKQA